MSSTYCVTCRGPSDTSEGSKSNKQFGWARGALCHIRPEILCMYPQEEKLSGWRRIKKKHYWDHKADVLHNKIIYIDECKAKIYGALDMTLNKQIHFLYAQIAISCGHKSSLCSHMSLFCVSRMLIWGKNLLFLLLSCSALCKSLYK